MGRRSQVDTSNHSEEIRHLLVDLRWGSRSVSRYLELKYGEEIPASTLRTWRARKVALLERQGKLPEAWREDGNPEGGRAVAVRLARAADEIPDLLGKRVALAQMQEARVRMDLEHELQMGKLFTSTVKELELLNRVYDAIRGDMQDLGLWPSRDAPTVQVNAQATAQAQQAQVDQPQLPRSLGELMPGSTPEERRELARTVLHAVREPAEPAVG